MEFTGGHRRCCVQSWWCCSLTIVSAVAAMVALLWLCWFYQPFGKSLFFTFSLLATNFVDFFLLFFILFTKAGTIEVHFLSREMLLVGLRLVSLYD